MIIFAGACSPLHCRLIVSLGGAISILLAFWAGFGLLSYFGVARNSLTIWIPFLLMVIGVEQIFVLCNALDQTDFDNNSYIRIHETLARAGPSITITSLTTVLAFSFGMISDILAFRGFCLFAAVSLTMLYLSNMTFFLAFLVWDTRRVEKHKKECFGLFCCAETSLFFCKGKCGTSAKKLKYSGNQ